MRRGVVRARGVQLTQGRLDSKLEWHKEKGQGGLEHLSEPARYSIVASTFLA